MGKEETEIRRIAIRCGFCTKKKECGRQEVEIVGDGDDVPARCLTHQNFVLQFLATDDARAESLQVQREWRELHCLSPPSTRLPTPMGGAASRRHDLAMRDAAMFVADDMF